MKILRIVLALAIGLVLGFGQDDGTILSRALAVTLSIFNANLNPVRTVGCRIAFGDGEAAIPGFHLDAVIGDAKTDGEAKSLDQPIRRRGRIGIDEHRNDDAGRHRPVESHLQTLSLNAGRKCAPLARFCFLVRDLFRYSNLGTKQFIGENRSQMALRFGALQFCGKFFMDAAESGIPRQRQHRLPHATEGA